MIRWKSVTTQRQRIVRKTLRRYTVEWNGGFLHDGNLGFFESLISKLLGSGNDPRATFVLQDFNTIESASMSYRAGSDVDIWLTNKGFDHADIPPDVDPLPLVP